MSSKAQTGDFAILLQGFRADRTCSSSINKLVERFRPIIKKLASSYDHFWLDDFIQEGQIGLMDAAIRYPESADPKKFISYASTVIRRRMVDFYRATIGKSEVEVIEQDEYAGSVTRREPLFISLSTYINEYGEVVENELSQISSNINYEVSTTLQVDFKYCFTEKAMLKEGFTDKEIIAFTLHFMKDQSVNEVAEQMKVSVGQASKLISKARAKTQLILSDTQEQINN